MTFKDEEIINEFIKAYHEKDYSKVAEMLRFIRSEVRRHPEIGEHVPVSDLINLIMSTNVEEVIDEVRLLLKLLFNTIDFPSILSTFGNVILPILRAENSQSVIQIGLDFMEKAATTLTLTSTSTPTLTFPHFDGVNDECLEAFLSLIAHPETLVANRVIQILENHPSPRILDRINSYLLKHDQKDDLVKVRIANLLSSIKVNDDNARWRQVQDLLDRKDDQLLMLSAFQIIQEQCKDKDDVSSLQRIGLLTRIVVVAMDSSIESLVRSKALDCLASISSIAGADLGVIMEELEFIKFIQNILFEGEDQAQQEDLTCQCIYLLACLSANRGLQNHNPELDQLLLHPLIIKGLFESIRDLHLACIAAYTKVFQTRNDQNLYIVLKAACHSRYHLFDFLTEKAARAIDEQVKSALYGLLLALLCHQPIIVDATKSSGLITFLLDRENEPSTLGANFKYQLVKVLSKSPSIAEPVLGQLNMYLSRGIIYKRSIGGPSIATESRN